MNLSKKFIYFSALVIKSKGDYNQVVNEGTEKGKEERLFEPSSPNGNNVENKEDYQILNRQLVGTRKIKEPKFKKLFKN